MPLKRQKAANGKCKAKTEAGHQWASSPERQRLLRASLGPPTEPPNSVAKAALATASCKRPLRLHLICTKCLRVPGIPV
jgi:hypothetical protein